MEWNERQLIALEALVAELEAGPLWQYPGHCDWFWENEARLKRLERKAREESNERVE
jgi:hypothetical protein